MEKIGEEFFNKHKVDPRKNPKARLRMLESIEKARIILSANIEAGVHIEYLIEELDLSRQVKRAEFEEMIAPNIDSLVNLMK